MGDDFDLFPKREHLDPFSFDSKEEEKESQEKGAQEEDVVFGDDQVSGEVAQPETPSVDLDEMPKPSIDGPEFDLPADFFSDDQTQESEPSSGEIFEEPPESTTGPIPDDVPDQPEPEDPGGGRKKGRRSKPTRKGPSAFVLVGGAILVILVLLWGALTYLKKEGRPVPLPPIQQKVQVPKPVPLPPVQQEVQAPEPEPVPSQPVESAKAEDGQVPPGQAPDESADGSAGGQEDRTPAVVQTQKQAPDVVPAAKKEQASAAAKSEGVLSSSRYSVQVGALILKSSVTELEKKLSGIGYEPFYKKGTTRATMNFLTAGPFPRDKTTAALGRIRKAGIESSIRHTPKGDVINAGGYLLSGNARRVSNRIRALGYPVTLERKETQMPITLVRVGKYATKADAARSRDELKKRGFDAIVVKLH